MKHEAIELAIIGGGAAGLFAAAAAVKAKVPAIVIERKARIGSKLLMTANGRCNFTKEISPERMLRDIGGKAAEFLRPALTACPPQRIAAFFRSHGVRTKRMMDGRLFPASERAADIVHVFGDLLREEQVPLLVNSPVTGLQRVKNGFIVGMENFTLWAKNVLIATGGASFPKTGSVGDGQKFAAGMGHSIEPLRAGLTGYSTRDSRVTSLAPRRCERAAAVVCVDGETVFRAEGEVEFEPWGVSGAAVYNCSRYIQRRNLKSFSLRLETQYGTFDLTDLAIRPLKEAIVTIGGVALDEIDPATMMSKKVEGLYFAGEVMDVDGPTGGYNISIAFATAVAAASAVAGGSRLSRPK